MSKVAAACHAFSHAHPRGQAHMLPAKGRKVAYFFRTELCKLLVCFRSTALKFYQQLACRIFTWQRNCLRRGPMAVDLNHEKRQKDWKQKLSMAKQPHRISTWFLTRSRNDEEVSFSRAT